MREFSANKLLSGTVARTGFFNMQIPHLPTSEQKEPAHETLLLQVFAQEDDLDAPSAHFSHPRAMVSDVFSPST